SCRSPGGPVSFPRRCCNVPFGGCSLLFPAVPPAEQDMREVGLPAPDRRAEPGGSARCPQKRVSRACCPQIPILGPAGRALLVRFGLVHQTSGGLRWAG